MITLLSSQLDRTVSQLLVSVTQLFQDKSDDTKVLVPLGEAHLIVSRRQSENLLEETSVSELVGRV